MRTEEQMARLAGKVAQLDSIGAGGVPTLTVEDIAGACRGMRRGPYLLARRAWAGDVTVVGDLGREVLHALVEREDVQRWTLPRAGWLRDLGLLAVHEVIAEQRCPRCKGTCYDGAGACRRCGGTGRDKLTEAGRANLMGLNRSNWSRTWSRRYETVYLMVLEWQHEARRHLQRELAA